MSRRGKIAKVETLPAVNVAWKLYKLSADANVSILTGSETGCSGITANLMRNKKQLLAYCVAALSYARIYSERNWKPDDIDKIVDIAWNINRRILMKRPMKMNAEHPAALDENTDVFYIDSIKFVTLTKSSIADGLINGEDMATVKEFFSLLLENGLQSCVVELNKNYFAFWSSNDKYFIFQPMNFFHKSPKCVQFASFDCVQLYLQKFFVEVQSQAEYVFHSVDILKINNNVLTQEEILKNLYQDPAWRLPTESGDFPNESFGSNNVSHKMCLLPVTQGTDQSYDQITEYKHILRCPKSIDRSGKISSTCVAAIVVLRVIRALLWSSDTLSDILSLGSKIYKESLKAKSKGQTEIRVADITGKIEFRSFECLIESQQMFFGKVESTVANICNIEQGLNQFFMSHIAGVIDGPNVVAVWKENNCYYMYDAKARNGVGLKLTKEENEAGETGASCVIRFKHLKDLAEIYVENVSKKERQDYYKITHIELKPFLGKNWYQWKVKQPGQWCLQGEESINLKENLSACVTALLYAESVQLKNWSPNTIDEIASVSNPESDYFNGENDLKEMRIDIVFKEKPAFAYIKQKMFRYVVHAVDKNIEDCLVKGFTMFFETNKHGIFSFTKKRTWKYFAIWKSGTNWFSFGLYRVYNEVTNSKKKEEWSALRFTSPADMVKSLVANFTVRKNQEFSLSSVSLTEEDQEKVDKKKLKNYKPVTALKGNAGILRIGKNFDLIGTDESDEAISKNTYNVAAVIALTSIKDCWSWSNYDVWDILKLSQKSFSVRLKELADFSIKIGTTAIHVEKMQTLMWKKPFQDQEELAMKSVKPPNDQLSDDQKKLVKFTTEDLTKKEKISDDPIKKEVQNNDQTNDQTIDEIKKETETNAQSEEQLVIQGFLKKFKKHDCSNAILRSRHLQLGFWKKDGAFFVFDMRDANEAGVCCSNEKVNKTSCPYVAWYDSMKALSEHIKSNLCETMNTTDYEFILFELNAKIENSRHKTWYNFTPVDNISDQWMIRSLYGSLDNQYGLTSCIIALVFASTLQPSNWHSSMLDSAVKYGVKLYKKSIKANPKNTSDLKLNTIVTPFLIGCYEFSFTAELLKCGANEHHALETSIANLFNYSEFGVISSKGYSASIWQQNNSFFIFDPQLNGMASLTRFSSIGQLSNHFLSHIRTGMTGVNIFEIFKISVSRKISKKKDCPVDLEAISKLTSRSLPDNHESSTNTTRMWNIISENEKWLEVGKSLPPECVLIAACVFGCYKNAEYWTSNFTEEILNLGEILFQMTSQRLNFNNSGPVKPDDIQGVYPFNEKIAIHIRMEIFRLDDDVNKSSENQPIADADSGQSMEGNTIGDDSPKAVLAKFFELYDCALLSTTTKTKNVTLTAWKQSGRFYVFSCETIEIDGHSTSTGQPRGVLLPFENVYELEKFLAIQFGDGTDLKDWLEIRYLQVDFVPIECLHDTKEIDVMGSTNVTDTSTCGSTLSGDLCRCSSDEQGHMEKHSALTLASIIMSTFCDMKTWTEKTLGQIEVYGKMLYVDAYINYQVKQLTIADFTDVFYIDHVEYKLIVSKGSTVHSLDQATLNDAMVKELSGGPALALYFVLNNTHSFSLIESDQIYYWYDPNGVDDPTNGIRSSVCCFGSMELVVDHILKLGTILQCHTFTVNFVRCQKL